MVSLSFGAVPYGKIIYAHRGASRELPENTLEAFALARELGAGAIETDAHLTRDGHVVLSHDPSGNRMAGVDRNICDTTLGEIRRWNMGARFSGAEVSQATHFAMPTLSEALDAFPDVLFNVDAKQVEPDMMPALLRCIRRRDACSRVRIASFSTKNLKRARSLGYEGPTGLSAPEVALALTRPLALARKFPVAGDAVQIPLSAYGVRLATPGKIARFHALGLRVDFWTVDDPALANTLFSIGADGVMTDDVRAICSRSPVSPDF